MAIFNDIDDDFCCPAACAIITMLTGPATCIGNICERTCVHPAAAEVSDFEASIGALPVQISLRIFSSVFQQPISFVQDIETGEQFLAMKDEDGNLMPMTPPLSGLEVDDFDALQAQQNEITELPTYDGPVL